MSELKQEPFVWQVRVYFEDTDAGGVVYHSRYLNFFERARTEMLRAIGISQTELREKHNLIWVVLDISVKFKKAARLDDELLVSAELLWVKGVRQGFRQKMTRISDGATVAEADLSAAMLHADSLKPARMPAWIKAELQQDAE
jgi:tol-pal system-associated acyl-CoA thioesterase